MPPQPEPEIQMGVLLNGGKGTRTGPIGKSIPKAMFPLGEYPIIHWQLAEKVAAGIAPNMVVVPPDPILAGPIREYFRHDEALFSTWQSKGIADGADKVEKLINEAHVIIEPQPVGRYGTAIGLEAAIWNSDLENTDFFETCYGDDLFLPEAGELTQVANLKQKFQRLGKSVVTMMAVDPAQASSYGVPILGEEVEAGVFRIKAIEEKPDQPKSDYAQFGSQILQFAVIDYIRELKNIDRDGEVVLATAVSNFAQDNEVYGAVFSGRRFDTGNYAGYVQAFNHYSRLDIDAVRQ